MPIYEYRCLKCDREFESIQRVDERDNGVECPSCLTAETVERVITKHSGYYINGDNSASVRPKGAGSK